MRKRVKIAFIALLVVVLGGVGWQLLPEREPVYQGKRLSKWLEGFTPNPKDDRPVKEQPQWQQADAAVRKIGTNAIPVLLRMLRAKDSSTKIALIRLLNRQRLFKIRYTSAAEQNDRASTAFGSLKENATGAVPALVQIYQENRSEYSQNAVIFALGSIGPTAEMAVPCLISAVASTDFVIRHNALGALGDIHAHPELAVPVLMKALSDPEPMIRGTAACGLRDFGRDAKPAVRALRELSKDQDSYARDLAVEALQQIEPETPVDTGLE